MNDLLEEGQRLKRYEELTQLDLQLHELRKKHNEYTIAARSWLKEHGTLSMGWQTFMSGVEERGRLLHAQRELLVSHLRYVEGLTVSKSAAPPQLGERILLLILTKEERVNIPGDLAEEFAEIAAKHGARYAKLWYYKQVAASVWPMIRKAAGWGLLTTVGAWIKGRL